MASPANDKTTALNSPVREDKASLDRQISEKVSAIKEIELRQNTGSNVPGEKQAKAGDEEKLRTLKSEKKALERKRNGLNPPPTRKTEGDEKSR